MATMAKRGFSMTVNVGTFDRIARVVVGLALIAFALGLIAPGTGWNWVGSIGVVPILTALFGTCPAYTLLGTSTR
jgi:sulfite exporter TauE/SafE